MVLELVNLGLSFVHVDVHVCVLNVRSGRGGYLLFKIGESVKELLRLLDLIVVNPENHRHELFVGRLDFLLQIGGLVVLFHYLVVQVLFPLDDSLVLPYF